MKMSDRMKRSSRIVQCVVNGHPVLKVFNQEIHYSDGDFKVWFEGRWSIFCMSDWISKSHGNDCEERTWNREFLNALAWLVK